MEWQGRTDGNRWMQQQLINCFRFLSLHIYYMGVAVVVPFYMLFGKGFKASCGSVRVLSPVMGSIAKGLDGAP